MHQSNSWIKSVLISASLLISVGLYYSGIGISTSNLQYIKLTEQYGLIALWCLFFAILAGPLYRVFPNFLFKSSYRASLGGLGISAFYFALLHGSVSFFKLLQGIEGLAFLGPIHLDAVLLGFVALLILGVLAGTSFTWAMNFFGKKWKVIHRSVYIAGFAILTHILLIGTHFRTFTWQSAPFFVAFIFLLTLHSISSKRALEVRFPQTPKLQITAIVVSLLLIIILILYKIHGMVLTFHVH